MSYVLRWTLLEQKNAIMFLFVYSEDRITLNTDSNSYYLDNLVKLIDSLGTLFHSQIDYEIHLTLK